MTIMFCNLLYVLANQILGLICIVFNIGMNTQVDFNECISLNFIGLRIQFNIIIITQVRPYSLLYGLDRVSRDVVTI